MVARTIITTVSGWTKRSYSYTNGSISVGVFSITFSDTFNENQSLSTIATEDYVAAIAGHFAAKDTKSIPTMSLSLSHLDTKLYCVSVCMFADTHVLLPSKCLSTGFVALIGCRSIHLYLRHFGWHPMIKPLGKTENEVRGSRLIDIPGWVNIWWNQVCIHRGYSLLNARLLYFLIVSRL